MVKLNCGDSHDGVDNLNGRIVRRLLSAACMASTLLLGACDAPLETGRQAQKDARDAARYQASAGQPRGNDQLITDVSAADDFEKLQHQAADEKTGPSLYKKYVTQNATAVDLAEAAKRIKAALTFDPSIGLKSALETEAGHIAQGSAIAKVDALRDPLIAFVQQAQNVLSQSQTVIDLGAQADALAASIKAPSPDAVAAAQKTADQKTQDTAAAKAKLAGVEQQIAGLLDQSRKIYADTDAAFLATKSMKPPAAVEAIKKVIEDRKAGDKAAEDAALLEPDHVAAQRALVKAQIDQNEADLQLAEAQETLKSDEDANKQTLAQIAEYRETAKSLVTGESGVASQYKEMTAAADAIEPKLKEALASASEALTSFTAASNDMQASISAMRTMVQEKGLDVAKADNSVDPLKRTADDNRPLAVSLWFKASAADQVGRINLLGLETMNSLATAAATLRRAKVAGVEADAAADKAADKSTAYAKAAIEAFTTADRTADDGNKKPSASGASMDNIRWIGLGIQAMGRGWDCPKRRMKSRTARPGPPPCRRRRRPSRATLICRNRSIAWP